MYKLLRHNDYYKKTSEKTSNHLFRGCKKLEREREYEAAIKA